MGTVADVLSDEAGLFWPPELAPYQIHLIALQGAEQKAEAAYEAFRKAGVQVLYDDRDAGAGEKFADADLIGLPFRAVVSKSTGDQVELKGRREKTGELVDLKELISRVS
ncbi:MAG: His/Gly/Thr/Pro-type tRNA ligase C-terminal domain-containing protein, partial [Candidatus Pacearchaeota archaeon]|nr:His/Gly/Thr/Pro-type tRNA ligase C-terminal domain-containing protein [Candidatus Pacearchaeota archaeon]